MSDLLHDTVETINQLTRQLMRHHSLALLEVLRPADTVYDLAAKNEVAFNPYQQRQAASVCHHLCMAIFALEDLVESLKEADK